MVHFKIALEAVIAAATIWAISLLIMWALDFVPFSAYNCA